MLARKSIIADLTARIAAREAEVAAIGRDQERVRENMRALEGLATLTAERTRAQSALEAFIAGLAG